MEKHRKFGSYGYGKYDTQILIQARRNLMNVYGINYQPSSRDTALLETIISKLDRLLKEYGNDEEVDAYYGKIYEDNKT